MHNHEKRHFFRMNVELPFYIHSLQPNQNPLQNIAVPSKTNQSFRQYKSNLTTLFQDETHKKNGAVELFSSVNQRIDFFVWLLDCMLQQQDPRQQADYFQRLEKDRLISVPEGNGKSSVFPLIHALFYRVDEMIAGLLSAIDSSVNRHVFLLTRPVYAPFSGARYLHNIEALSTKGNWLANVLEQLILKLNVYEQAYSDFKNYFKDLSYPERWPIKAVNLSTGGLAFETEQACLIGELYCILLQLNEHLVISQATVVATVPIGSDDNSLRPTPMHRVSFEFQAMSATDQSYITQFVTEQELAFAHPELK